MRILEPIAAAGQTLRKRIGVTPSAPEFSAGRRDEDFSPCHAGLEPPTPRDLPGRPR